MYLYSKTFIHKNKEAKIIALACLLFGGLIFAAAGAGVLPIPAISELIGLILIVVAIYIASCYLLRQYTVSVELNKKDEDNMRDAYDLIVRERKGKKLIKVCHIGLENMISLEIVDKKAKKDDKKQIKDAYRYIYDTELFSKKRISLLCETGGYKSLIYLSFDDELFGILRENIGSQTENF